MACCESHPLSKEGAGEDEEFSLQTSRVGKRQMDRFFPRAPPGGGRWTMQREAGTELMDTPPPQRLRVTNWRK